MFQMDLIRRRAGGELAAVFGGRALESDRGARQLRVRRLAAQHVRQLGPAERAVFAAYARGVNHYLESNRNRLPVEFTLAGYEPRPWSMVDSMLTGLEMFRLLTTSWNNEVLQQQFYSLGDREMVGELFPSTVGSDARVGSNAWALGGKHTQSGQPILANDPHLPFSAPPIWYLAHITAEDLDVIGGTLPGLPGVITGHNRRIAWGATNLWFDVQDLYAERLDILTGRYVSGGQLRQALRDREWVEVKDSKPVEFGAWVTDHGPVVVSTPQYHLALRWTAAAKDGFGFPFLDINRASNWSEFRAALERFSGPAQNFVFADVDGNIGYQAAGFLPVRRHDGSVPADGASGQFEWNGYIPFDELPSLFNPESGLIVSANQNPFQDGYPYRVGGNFAAPYRANRIRQLLKARQGWTPEEMIDVQRDVYSSVLHYLAGETVKAYDQRGLESESVGAAVELLRSWNGEMDAGQAAPLVAALLFQHLRKAIAERAAPGAGAGYDVDLASLVVERLVRERPEAWFDDYDPLLLRSLLDAIDEGQR
ncbi:MAG: penicillin acylase family protein, partial [bacterium]|nr:penicillin acylase family protein [bacterium]